jgi:hypothetical protein
MQGVYEQFGRLFPVRKHMPLQGESRAKLAFWKVIGKTGHQKRDMPNILVRLTSYCTQFTAVFCLKKNVLLALNYIYVILCFIIIFTPRVVKKIH